MKQQKQCKAMNRLSNHRCCRMAIICGYCIVHYRMRKEGKELEVEEE